MNFTQAMAKSAAIKKTENGLDALNTSFNKNLDLFAQIGAVRKRNDYEIENMVADAFYEDKELCFKNVFYARDREEGLGERRAFRVAIHKLAELDPASVAANLDNFLKFGRFDDIFALEGTKVEKDMWNFIRAQWNADIDNYNEHKPISLMAKWLKSINASSAETRRLAAKTATELGFTSAEYRKNLSLMRKYIDVLETKLSANEWSKVNFNAVPGGAMKKYCKAFGRHETERYAEYLDALKTGKKIVVKGKEVEAKINTKHLMPYELVEKYGSSIWRWRNMSVQNDVEAMWKGIQDYVGETSSNIVVMADTSGSMDGRPMATSVGLAIYFAQHNHGPYRNKFMTFSSRPSWVELNEGASLRDCLVKVPDICDNTNLEAAFDLILNVATTNKLSQEDLPSSLVIITDMEFDSCVGDNNTIYNGWWGMTSNLNASNMETFYDKMAKKYANFGYKLPEIVFWNADARQSTFHVTKSVPRVRLVSGQAASVFKGLVDGKVYTAEDYMKQVLGRERYNCVIVK